jgi:hypothetical protein
VSPRPGLAAAAGAAALIALAGCGSARTAAGPPGTGAGRPALSLATALVSGSGAGWAVLRMGGLSAQHEDFWQLFVRPAGTARWKLATPAGVASNGGLVIAATGAASLVAGFRPSQDLTFSPLAGTTDGGGSWSHADLVSPGLADLPGGLAAAADGRLIALTDGGGVQLGTRMGASWTALTSEHALALSAPGRACALTSLTAAAWTPAGTPLLGGGCARTGTVGIFALHGGAWQAAGPSLPASLAGRTVGVAGLSTAGRRTTAVLTVGHGVAASIIVAWSDDGGGRWTLSAAATGASELRSVSILTGGAAWLVLAGLPAGTATMAAGPAGQVDALAAAGGTLTAWQLGSGSAGWTRLQTTHVTIPYGSSG